MSVSVREFYKNALKDLYKEVEFYRDKLNSLCADILSTIESGEANEDGQFMRTSTPKQREAALNEAVEGKRTTISDHLRELDKIEKTKEKPAKTYKSGRCKSVFKYPIRVDKEYLAMLKPHIKPLLSKTGRQNNKRTVEILNAKGIKTINGCKWEVGNLKYFLEKWKSYFFLDLD